MLQRNFTFLSIAGFVMILQSSWESTLLVASYGLTNGGTAGTIWMTVFVITGVMCMICSMAEMASMAPTAGGQYHWVSEFAPPSVQKPLSYIVGAVYKIVVLRSLLTYLGWCCCLGWVTGNPAAAQLTSTLIQGLVLLKNENANISTLWQTTLLIMVFLVIACSFNIWLARTLPMAEGIFLMLHIFGFFAFLLVLWIMSDHAPAADVFTKFDDLGGWGNKGLSTLVGITTPLWCFLCPDAGAHMAEELKDAGSVLPKAMVWSTAVNAFFGLVMIITLCFCIGDIEAVLDSPTGYPIIQVLYNSTGSYSGTVVMTVLLLILSLVGTITCVAATSRQMWAFARDKGFPFSSYIERVRFLLPCPALLSKMALLTRKNTGQTRLGHPRQRHRHRLRHLHAPYLPQFRLRRRPWRHPLRQQRLPSLLLHLFYRLCSSKASPRPTFTPPSVVPRQIRRPRERCRVGVFND